MNETIFNVSSGPHIRQDLNTGSVMRNVCVALLPAAVFGVFHFGLRALLIIVCSIAAAELSEWIVDRITGRKNTLSDWSAVVTGLLLALSLPPTVPLYIPVLGSVFAIVVVKGCFGGLGKNIMNPALAARCFLLLSFSTQMTDFAVDGVSGATPLELLRAGESIRLADVYLGFSNSVIGGSALALLIGGLYLWASGGITIHIPLSCIAAFTVFVGFFSGKGADLPYLIAQICAGGILMGAFFMATDPVTSPMTGKTQILYGVIIGLLAGLFRVKGASADSVSYSIIIANMFVPLIDKLPVPKPLGYKEGEYRELEFPKAAVNLCVIALIMGLALSGVYAATKQKIADQELAKNAASYQEVLAQAQSFTSDADITAAIDALGGEPYDASNRTYVNQVVVGQDADGQTVGYVVSVTSGKGYGGNITLSVGIDAEGKVEGIAFTELNETAGKGSRAEEPEFRDQFAGVLTDAFTLMTSGASSDGEINAITGATVTSSAVVNAVNTALAFYAEHIA